MIGVNLIYFSVSHVNFLIVVGWGQSLLSNWMVGSWSDLRPLDPPLLLGDIQVNHNFTLVVVTNNGHSNDSMPFRSRKTIVASIVVLARYPSS